MTAITNTLLERARKHVALSRRRTTFSAIFLSVVIVYPASANNNVGNTGSISWTFSGTSTDVVNVPPLYSVPQARDGELQEIIPGVVMTQQYGAGAASHYFMRGENLIYGSGVYTTFDDIPLSLDQHSIVNGYTDLNAIIPVLISKVEYKKGPYSTGTPGPSASGSINYVIPEKLAKSVVEMSLGEGQYFHMLAATSDSQLNGNFVYAVDLSSFDGPWESAPEDKRKITAYMKQSWHAGIDRYNVSLFGFRNNWNALSPIPQRAVEASSLSDLSTVDPGDNGKRRLMGVSAQWQRQAKKSVSKAVMYFYGSEFRLLTNNTYYLFDAINGDQLEQVDKRNSLGLEYSYQLNGSIGGAPVSNKVGAQLQRDLIGEDGLYKSIGPGDLTLLSNYRTDAAKIGLYWENNLHFAQNSISRAGLRFNQYQYDVGSSSYDNIVTKKDSIVTGDVGLDRKLSATVHTYVNVGRSFITNKIRDVLGATDPLTGASQTPKNIFIPVTAGEIGVNYQGQKVTTSLALWRKNSDAEIVLAPETNTAISTRASQRSGVEWLAKYVHKKYLSFDLSATYANIKYTEKDPANPSLGDAIPGIPKIVGKIGISYHPAVGYFLALEDKYVGKRPLNEDNTQVSDAFTVMNLRMGYQWRDLIIHVDILNLFDNDAHEVDYLYTSRLQGEAANGVQDIHYRVLLPRTIRLTATHDF